MAVATTSSPPKAKQCGTVLVIDDMQFCRELVAEALRANGYTAVGASNGVQGLAALEKQNVDLVVCDIEMPQMNGFEFMKVLRSKPQWQNLPVILLSGGIDRDRVMQAGKLGAAEYMLKTNFSLDKLLDRVNRRMASRGTAKPAAGPARPPAAQTAPGAAKAAAPMPGKPAAPTKPSAAPAAKASSPISAAAKSAAPAAAPAPPAAKPAAPAAPPRRSIHVCTDTSKIVFPKLLERDQVLGAVAECGKQAKTLAGVVSEILSLTSSGTGNVTELAALVRQDPILTGKIIRMANTAALTPGKGRIVAIEDAVRNIGAEGVRNIASTTGMLQAFQKNAGDGIDLLRLWEHSIAAAVIMDRIVPRSFEPAPGAAYLMGLCHDLAELLLREHFPEQFVAAMDFAAQQQMSVRQMFSKVSGTSFAELTQLLVAALRLPQHAATPICEYATWEEGGTVAAMNPLAVALRVANFHANAMQLTSSARDATLAPLSQSECRTACIAATPLNTAEIRSEAIMTVSMLARSANVEAELKALMAPSTKPTVWYLRHPSFSPLDPLEESLKLVSEVSVHDHLPSKEAATKLDGLIVAMPRRDCGGVSIDSVARWKQGLPGTATKVIYLVDEPSVEDATTDGCCVMHLPIVLADLLQILGTFSS